VGMSYVVMQARFKATETYTTPTEHALTRVAEYLKTRLGLSGLPLPPLILNHGRREGAYQNKHVTDIGSDTPRHGRTSDCPRVRRVSKRRSSTPSLARVCIYFTLLTALIPMDFSDWYDIKAPSIFEVKNVGKTLVNRSQGLSMSD